MKYTNGRAFFKHLQASSPGCFTPVYLIAACCAFDRKMSLEALLHFLTGGKREPLGLKSFDGEAVTAEALGAELNAFSLFAEKRILLIKGCDKLKAGPKHLLESYLESPCPRTHLILTASSLPGNSKLGRLAEKKGVVLLLSEKKEEPAAAWLCRLAESHQKRLDPGAAAALLKRAGSDQMLLAQEIEKLACYVGRRAVISESDVCELSPHSDHEKSWHLGEAIFGRRVKSALETAASLLREGISPIALLRQLRRQFEVNLTLLELMARGGEAAALEEFPYMRGRILARHLEMATRYGAPSLKAGLIALDAAETEAKNSPPHPELLLELLTIRLCDALPSSQPFS